MGTTSNKRNLTKRSNLTFRSDFNDSFTPERWEFAEDGLQIHLRSTSPSAVTVRQAQYHQRSA